MANEGEDYPSGSHVFTVPKYDESADAPQAFKNFADSITDGLGLDFDAARAGQVVQADDSKDWAAGPVMKVVQDLPDETDPAYVEGDVVFVLGDVPKAGGGGLEGLGDWAEITAMTGDPKRYTGITVDGVEFWAFEWTADGEVTTSGGLVDVFMVSGGAGDNPAVARGNGGPYQRGLVSFPTDPVTVDVGRGGASGNSYAVYVGHESSLSANSNILMLSAAAGCSNLSGGATSADAFRHVTDDITGPERTYSAAGGNNHPSGTGIGDGGPSGRVGSDGVVIVRVPKDKVTATGGWV